MIGALLLAQILFYTLPSGYPPVQGRGVMILGFGIEPMVIRPEAMESYLPTVVHRPDWTMASVPWVEPATELENPDVGYVGVGYRTNCYVPGEAHNELTLPCVTIEP